MFSCGSKVWVRVKGRPMFQGTATRVTLWTNLILIVTTVMQYWLWYADMFLILTSHPKSYFFTNIITAIIRKNYCIKQVNHSIATCVSWPVTIF